MNTKRIESFKEFSQYLEYPMVVFEEESGNVLELNYEAEVLLGSRVKNIRIEPGRAMTKQSFWEMLHGKKSLLWHRIRMIADGKEVLVSGLINEMSENGQRIYALLFERRADLNIGSLTLERIVNDAGLVALHGSIEEGAMHIDYISQNVNQYGYTRAQFYENKFTFDEVICAEDMGRLQEHVREMKAKHAKESEIECRLVTEERQLIPVRLMMYYVYNDYGTLTDLEIMVVDLREELRKNRENLYLSNGIAKSKSVVLVKSYNKDKRLLKYISPNAGMIGMNIDALEKGYRLTEDYIYPEDRDQVIDSIYQAVENGITDYVQVYRMVRDDGKKIWVENDVTVTRISDGEAEISFLLTDITEQKEMEVELATTMELSESAELAEGLSANTTDEQSTDLFAQFDLMAKTLSQNANYYTVVMDSSGKLLTSPAGPQNDIGLFYDLFERPPFKERFIELSGRANVENIPQSMSFEEGSMQVHMVMAPLYNNETIIAYWVLTSFEKDGMESLGMIAEQQWKLANVMVKSFYADELIKQEAHHKLLLEAQLHKEQEEIRVLQDILQSFTRDGEMGLGEICQKAAMHLSIEKIGIYVENKETDRADIYYTWNLTGDASDFFRTMSAAGSEYNAINKRFEDDSLIIVDRNTEEAFLKNQTRQAGMGCIVLSGFALKDGTKGYVMLADSDVMRVFDKKNSQFVLSLTQIFVSILQNKKNASTPELLQEGFLDAYNHIRDAVLVKNNRTGEVMFANKAMDKLFGYSVVGMQIREILNDQMEHYRNISGVRKRFIANKKVTKWQSYMKELDQIMNIVEVQLDVVHGADISLVILKKNKNKDKKKD